MAKSAECPVCAADVEVQDDVMMGEILVCPECGTDLEVVSLDPLQIDEAPMELEDFGE